MQTSFKYLIVISLLTAMFCGCKKGGSTPEPIIPDTTKPTISIVKPTAGQIFVPGNTIAFQATFTDNVNLKNYDIAITKVVASAMVLKNVPVLEAWSYTKASTSFTSGVKQADITFDIPIPLLNTNSTSISPGKYNFKVTCVDGSDNSISTTIEININ